MSKGMRFDVIATDTRTMTQYRRVFSSFREDAAHDFCERNQERYGRDISLTVVGTGSDRIGTKGRIVPVSNENQ